MLFPRQKFLAVFLVLLFTCAPLQTYTFVSESPTHFRGQKLSDCYEVLRVTPIYYTYDTAYRITIKDLPKRKQRPPTYEESLKDTSSY
jgi:hypothetical protein